jgi:signal peptidase
MKYVIPIPIIFTIIYLLTNLIVPTTFSGITIFFADALLWTIAIIAAILLFKFSQINPLKTDKTLIQLAIILAIFQIFVAIFASFFMGFAKNPVVWTPLVLGTTLPYLLAPFIATELSRAYLATKLTTRKPTIALILISIFFTLTLSTISKYTELTTLQTIVEFLIKTFIPNLSVSLLATYMAFLGGFPANLIYMAIPAAFTWFSPILPNPPWEAQSMLTVIAATIGFIVLDTTVKPIHPKQTRKTLKKQKSQLPYWTAVALIGLVAVWSSSGLLGFTPTIIASGSMQPTLNPGDIVIIINAPPATIKIGDIIQYQTTEAPTIHRVIDKYESGGTFWFITQGDANNAPDNPVNERNVMGKVVLTIPKLGWISIYLKEFFASAYTFITTTLPNTITESGTFILKNGIYITTALAITAYSYLLLTYNQHKKEEKT